jgi:hypothetical protein
MPDERCQYSGTCCSNKRVMKSNGRLHRLCKEHRARANLNQRSTRLRMSSIIRPRQVLTGAPIDSSLEIAAEIPMWVELADLWDFSVPVTAAPTLAETDWLDMQMSATPTSVDTRLDGDIPLSDADIDVLTTIVAQFERSGEAMAAEDTSLLTILQEVQDRDSDSLRCTASVV